MHKIKREKSTEEKNEGRKDGIKNLKKSEIQTWIINESGKNRN